MTSLLTELPEGSIAYHRIWGFITSDCQWYFSSKQFERDLLAAEANTGHNLPFPACELSGRGSMVYGQTQ